MESVERLKKQLSDLTDLRDIVKTMKALSAASIRQYEHAAQALADYHRTIELGLHAALRDADASLVAASSRRRGPSVPGLVVFGSDHGLCGRFNEDVVGRAVDYLATSGGAGRQCRVLAVGARAAGILERDGLKVEEDLIVPGSAARIAATVLQVLLKIDEWRQQGDVARVMLFHNRVHAGSTSCKPVTLQLLPVDLHRLGTESGRWPSRSIPGFSLPRQKLLPYLLRQYFFVMISRACADSQAAEHGSRLVAMQAADRNLGDRLEEVTMLYHRARQTVITAELLEVVSGFEAITRSSTQ